MFLLKFCDRNSVYTKSLAIWMNLDGSSHYLQLRYFKSSFWDLWLLFADFGLLENLSTDWDIIFPSNGYIYLDPSLIWVLSCVEVFLLKFLRNNNTWMRHKWVNCWLLIWMIELRKLDFTRTRWKWSYWDPFALLHLCNFSVCFSIPVSFFLLCCQTKSSPWPGTGHPSGEKCLGLSFRRASEPEVFIRLFRSKRLVRFRLDRWKMI